MKRTIIFIFVISVLFPSLAYGQSTDMFFGDYNNNENVIGEHRLSTELLISGIIVTGTGMLTGTVLIYHMLFGGEQTDFVTRLSFSSIVLMLAGPKIILDSWLYYDIEEKELNYPSSDFLLPRIFGVTSLATGILTSSLFIISIMCNIESNIMSDIIFISTMLSIESYMLAWGTNVYGGIKAESIQLKKSPLSFIIFPYQIKNNVLGINLSLFFCW